jgi:hypothetical protein
MIMETKRGISAVRLVLCATVLVVAARAKADSPSASDAQSIVINGGFEDWQSAPQNLQKSLDCPQVPTGWGVQTGPDRTSCSLRSDAAVKHGGRFSVRLANANTKSGLSVAQRIDAQPEYRYLIHVWLKGDHIDAYHPKGIILHATASSQCDKNDISLWTGILRESSKTPSPHSGTFDWQETVFTVDTPLDTRSMVFLVELRGAGVVWVDDVQVTRLEKCIQVESY